MKKWYQIQAKKDKVADINIFEEIGKDWWNDGSAVAAKQFISDVKALGDIDTINLFINSPGGSVFEGNTIYNYLKSHSATINVKIMGIAASIASVIAMAGTSIEMPENSMMMIHDPSGGVWGTAGDMLKMADALGKVKVGLVAAYRNKSGMTDEAVGDLMSDETWLTAKEAVALGLADTITESIRIDANLDSFKNFKKIPMEFIAGLSGKQKKQEDEPMEITVEVLKKDYPEIVKALQSEVDVKAVRETAMKEGAAAELARIKDVQAQLIPGHEALIAVLAFDGKTSGPEAAVQMVNAERKLRDNTLANLKTDAPDPVKDLETVTTVPDNSNLPLKDKCEAEWKKDAKIRAEFLDDFDAYLAFREAETGGQVRLLKK